MKINKDLITKIFDYLIPCLLIGLVLGISIFIIYSSGLLNTNNNENPVNTEVKVIDNNIGLLRKDGKLYINTLSGNKIYVPNYFKRKMEETIVNYLVHYNEKKHDKTFLNESEDPYSIVFFTKQYSLLLLVLSKEMKEKDSQPTYLTFAIYAEKIANIEENLIDIRNILYESNFEYELNKLYYKKAAQNWTDIWTQKFDCIKKPGLKGCPISQLDIINAYTDFNNTYINYRNSVKNLKVNNENLAPKAEEYYNDLKKDTGSNFDLLLNSIRQDTKVSSYVKNLAESLGEEIKLIKDKINITTTRDDELTSYIEFNNPNIKETVSFFDIINISINDKDSYDIKCLSNCIYEGKTDCYNICD